MPDPKEIHESDQNKAAGAHLGAVFAAMLTSMVQEGVPLPKATEIVAAYARGLGSKREGGNG